MNELTYTYLFLIIQQNIYIYSIGISDFPEARQSLFARKWTGIIYIKYQPAQWIVS